MVKKSLGVNSAKELDGASFCIQAGTTTELNLTDYFRSNNMAYTPITFDTSPGNGSCFRRRPLRCTHFRPVSTVCIAYSIERSGRSRGSAGDHIQGATGPCSATG